MRLSRILSLVGLLAFPVAGWADEPPFGLHWGDTLEALTDRGIVVDILKNDGKSLVLSAKHLRGTPAPQGSVQVIVNKTFGLQRVIWTSNEIGDTAFGTQGVAAYQDKKRNLSKDLGQPRFVAEEMWAESYSSPDQFYQCLGSDGCGTYMSKWRTDDGDVTLRLIAAPTANRGQLQITYNGPSWEDISNGKSAKAKEQPGNRY